MLGASSGGYESTEVLLCVMLCIFANCNGFLHIMILYCGMNGT